ncbi:hypothetical protein L207DRAFT_388990, partial [Hyaloscypha variabilis F]
EIRILRLYHGKRGDALKCTLFPSSLPSTRSTSKSNCFEYNALLYEWGDNIAVDLITSGAWPLYIRASLAAALQELRQENEDVNLWVVDVCINHANIVERNAQVKLMSRIYKEAISVCFW